MQRGMLGQKILGFLEAGARTSGEVLAFFIGSSGHSHGGIGGGVRAVRALRQERWRENPRKEWLRQEYKRLQKRVQALRCDKLVQSEKGNGPLRYFITSRGRHWLRAQLIKKQEALPRGVYPKKESECLIVFMYDIPHKRRKYRDWLRGELHALGFKPLQKSVFIGKVQVPKILMDDLVRFYIIDYVEIFEITKKGTLRAMS